MSGWYVYGVVAAGSPCPVDGARLVEQGALAAVAREVSLDEFGDDALPERLEDPTWVAEVAQAHEDVLQAMAAVAPVVPLRFGAVFRDADEVRAMLDERHPAFETALERVAGRVEIGVKAWAGRTAPEPVAAVSGRAYLEGRLAGRRRAEEAAADRAGVAHAAHERLLRLAVAGVANRPQPRELTGREEDMLLNGAYLVAAGDDALAGEVRRLAAEHAPLGVAYEITGPWPPHNFVGEEA